MPRSFTPGAASAARLARRMAGREARRASDGSSGAPQTGGGGDHRRRASVDGVDDLGVVDPLQIHACDPEVCVPQLPLDDYHRHAFVREFDCVRMTELMGR